MVCRWIESTFAEPERPLLSPFVKFDIWFRRWMDDIFGVILVFVAPQASVENRADIEKSVDTYLANQLAPYERQFVMKVEDPTIFVGMKVFAENASLWFMPDPTIRLTPTGIAVHRFKFQNWCSSAEVVMKIRLIVSQICQATDRTSTELLLIRAIANLALEFRAVSFPWPVLRNAFETNLKKHPYLGAVRKGLVHALQTESLFIRAGYHFYFTD